MSTICECVCGGREGGRGGGREGGRERGREGGREGGGRDRPVCEQSHGAERSVDQGCLRYVSV